ncbi:response regulator [Leptolyngbya cf. ectocarpi LEGE 11479]|uniref:Response regulator n=1 Tax=Leptolyngbya cf. ectocarpi LEGE 11479 TaxID=1828722 RepID=A0A929A0A2_LEPEC|nr:response regulator [Leptolyngbya ectocarpi]MBE9070705.1 response regulator [Leptolyngbya cf. ectocarpi LEGE 11479]
MVTYASCNVLLIDDDPSVFEQVQALLAESKPAMDASGSLFQLSHVERLNQGLEVLSEPTYQVVLLDLHLPDSQGIDTLERLRQAVPTIPTVVLTGTEDEVIAVRAIEAGAQGFLSKHTLDPNLLAYALLLALERQRQLNVALQSTPTAQGLTEIENFERLAYTVRPATVTASLFESGLLKDSIPDIFRQIVEDYSHVLDQVLEQQTFRVEYPISENLRSLAEKLGFLKAGARDVVELHTLALKQKNETENVIKARAYADAGRLVVLELMGYLTTYYRKYFIGLSKLNASIQKEES